MTTREEWLTERRKGIGGSDVAPILGLSPFKTALQVYLDKRGESEGDTETEPMTWGRYLEPAIRQRYADVTGRSVELPAGVLRHPSRAWQLATVDGLVNSNRVLEIKTARSGEGWGEPGTDEIPDYYLPQVAHYLAVTGREVADVAVLIAGCDFRIYEVPFDRELDALLTDAEAKFWERVQQGDPPPPTTVADAVALFGKKSDPTTTVTAAVDVEAAVARLRDVKARLKQMETEEDTLKTQIMNTLGFAEVLVTVEGKPLVTWKTSKSAMRVDVSRLQAEKPDVYQQYLSPGAPQRRFLVK